MVCYLHVCFNFSVFFFLNITSLNHRLVLVSKWTKITVVLRFFFSKIYLRIFCITNTKTHLPYTDLYSFLKKKNHVIFPVNSFVGVVFDFNTLLIEFDRLFWIKSCMYTYTNFHYMEITHVRVLLVWDFIWPAYYSSCSW